MTAKAALAPVPEFQPDPRLGIGGNAPPLSEVLAEETAPIVSRVGALLDKLGKAKITDDRSSGDAVALAGLTRDTLRDIDAARETRKKPYWDAGKEIDRHFQALGARLAVTDPRGKVIGGPLGELLSAIDAYRVKKDQEAAAERRRLEEEARRQREAAERAERERREAEAKAERDRIESERKVREAQEAERRATNAKEAAKAQRKREAAQAEQARLDAANREATLQAELDQRRAHDEADRLLRERTPTTSTIDSGLGFKASSRSVKVVEITDWNVALRHAWKIAPDEIKAAVLAIYNRQAKAKVATLPGAEIKDQSTTVIRGAS